MIIQQGMDRIRDKIAEELTKGELGSDGTAVTLADTEIGAAIAGTDKVNTVTTFFNGIKVEYVTDAGDGDGNDAREFVIRNNADLELTRVVFPEIAIDSFTEIAVNTQFILLQEL